jgi:hypothetical protein
MITGGVSELTQVERCKDRLDVGCENWINVRWMIVSLERAGLWIALFLVEVNGDRSGGISRTKAFLENFATRNSYGNRVVLDISAHFLVDAHVLLMKSSRYVRCLTSPLYEGDTSASVEPV